MIFASKLIVLTGYLLRITTITKTHNTALWHRYISHDVAQFRHCKLTYFFVSMLIKRHNIFFIAMLAVVGIFSTDIYLASMPTLREFFQTSTSNIQLTLSLYFLTFGVFQIFWGSLSDNIGRKPVLIFGLLLYIAASMLCVFSTNITVFILARIFQAFGACSTIVMSSAIIRDLSDDKDEIANLMILTTRIFLIAPMLAPVIGSHLLAWFHWQANFIFLAGFALLILIMAMFFKETHPKSTRHKLMLRQIFPNYVKQLKHKPFLVSALAGAFVFSMIFAFLSVSAHIYISLFHMSVEGFGYLFLINTTSFMLANLLLTRLKKSFSLSAIMFFGLSMIMIGSFLMVLLLCVHDSLIDVVVSNYIITFGLGVLSPLLSAQTLSHSLLHKGIAASCNGVSRSGISAVVGYLFTLFIGHSALPFAVGLSCIAILILFLLFQYRRL